MGIGLKKMTYGTCVIGHLFSNVFYLIYTRKIKDRQAVSTLSKYLHLCELENGDEYLASYILILLCEVIMLLGANILSTSSLDKNPFSTTISCRLLPVSKASLATLVLFL